MNTFKIITSTKTYTVPKGIGLGPKLNNDIEMGYDSWECPKNLERHVETFVRQLSEGRKVFKDFTPKDFIDYGALLSMLGINLSYVPAPDGNLALEIGNWPIQDEWVRGNGECLVEFMTKCPKEMNASEYLCKHLGTWDFWQNDEPENPEDLSKEKAIRIVLENNPDLSPLDEHPKSWDKERVLNENARKCFMDMKGREISEERSDLLSSLEKAKDEEKKDLNEKIAKIDEYVRRLAVIRDKIVSMNVPWSKDDHVYKEALKRKKDRFKRMMDNERSIREIKVYPRYVTPKNHEKVLTSMDN